MSERISVLENQYLHYCKSNQSLVYIRLEDILPTTTSAFMWIYFFVDVFWSKKNPLGTCTLIQIEIVWLHD